MSRFKYFSLGSRIVGQYFQQKATFTTTFDYIASAFVKCVNGSTFYLFFATFQLFLSLFNRHKNIFYHDLSENVCRYTIITRCKVWTVRGWFDGIPPKDDKE